MRDYVREIGSMLYSTRTRKPFKTNLFSRSTMGAWEGGQQLPPLGRCEEIAQVYGIDVEQFQTILEEATRSKEEIKRLRASLRKRSDKKSLDDLTSGAIYQHRQNTMLNKKSDWHDG